MPAHLRSLSLVFILLLAACGVTPADPADSSIFISMPAGATLTPFRPDDAPALAATPQPATPTAVPATASPLPPTATPQPSQAVQAQPQLAQAQAACRFPNGWARYLVRSGDTLYQISQSYGMTVAQLQQANCMSGSLIYAGQNLYVPHGVAATRPPASALVDTLTPPSQATDTPASATLPVVYNQPGTYIFSGHCQVITLPYLISDNTPVPITVDMCVASVQVHENGNMQFHLTWTAHVPGTRDAWATKGSDVGNPNMNVTDNLGNRYDHIGLDGIAAQDTALRNGQTGVGSYLFPPAQPGATVFTFHDDDQPLAIGDIVLAK